MKERRAEVEQRLAAFGLGRGPRRLPRGAGAPEGEEGRVRRLRAALESLGPIFSSFGLYMASRVDLLPAEDCLELAAIRDRAEALPPSIVRALFGRELGCRPEDLFLDFEEKPFESGLLTQTHNAWLHDGRAVSVKLLRPEAEALLPYDAELLPLLKVAFAGRGGAALDGAIADFRSMLGRKADLGEEARSLEALAQDAREFGLLRVAPPQTALCTPRMLTVERAPGRALGELLSTPAGAGWEAGAGALGRVDRAGLARRLCVVWLRQATHGSLFPVEFGPADITFLPGGEVVLTGGVFATLPPDSKATLWEYLLAAASENPDLACSCLMRELNLDESAGEEGELRQRFRQVVPFRDGAWDDEGNSLAGYLHVHWKLAAHGCPSPPHLSSFFRGLLLVAGCARRLAPEKDTLAEGLQDVRFIQGVERFKGMVGRQQMGEQMSRYAAVMLELPQRLDQVLTMAADGDAGLKLRLPETVEQRRRKNSSAALASLLLMMASFVLLAQHVTVFAGPLADGVKTVVFIALGALVLRAASRD